jgi:hypothetical protein
MENLLEQVLHCDGWYFDGVCSSRGEPDPADIRYDRDGFARPTRHICLTNGQCPLLDYALCPHCVELKSYFRAKPRRKVFNVKR